METSSNVTIVLFMRHEEHENNILSPKGILNAIKYGEKLKSEDIEIDVAISSPQWRCIQTVQYVLKGMNKMIYLSKIDHRFSDILSDSHVDQNLVAKTFAISRKTGIGKESLLYQETLLKPHLIRRGYEGALAILDAVFANMGKTILICSHGGSRMEPSLLTLLGKDVLQPPFFFERGSIAKLVFHGISLRSFDYWGVPSK